MLGFNHVAIVVRDLKDMEQFYTTLLNLPVVKRWQTEKGAERSVWLGLEGGFLALEQAEIGTPYPRRGEFSDQFGGWYVFALSIPLAEREKWIGKLQRAQVAIERLTPFSIFFRDIEGNRIALSHWPEEAPK